MLQKELKYYTHETWIYMQCMQNGQKSNFTFSQHDVCTDNHFVAFFVLFSQQETA